jgi:hypothetical protein
MLIMLSGSGPICYIKIPLRSIFYASLIFYMLVGNR